jgi:hypothetical protein
MRSKNYVVCAFVPSLSVHTCRPAPRVSIGTCTASLDEPIASPPSISDRWPTELTIWTGSPMASWRCGCLPSIPSVTGRVSQAPVSGTIAGAGPKLHPHLNLPGSHIGLSIVHEAARRRLLTGRLPSSQAIPSCLPGRPCGICRTRNVSSGQGTTSSTWFGSSQPK